MYQILIADDEEKVRDLLAKNISKLPLDLEVAAVAGDGREALELALKLKPDIVITDIAMPFLNGLELKAQIYNSNTGWLILVDTSANRVGVYRGYVNNWNEVKYWPCTSGAMSTPTVKGAFTVQGRGTSFGSGYTCWYYTQFYGNYLFHSVLYKQGSKSTIIDGRLGINASHGCVRLSIENAKWIYDTIPSGTKVIVY